MEPRRRAIFRSANNERLELSNSTEDIRANDKSSPKMFHIESGYHQPDSSGIWDAGERENTDFGITQRVNCGLLVCAAKCARMLLMLNQPRCYTLFEVQRTKWGAGWGGGGVGLRATHASWGFVIGSRWAEAAASEKRCNEGLPGGCAQLFAEISYGVGTFL